MSDQLRVKDNLELSMEMSLQWLYRVQSKYVALESKQPIAISDWHNEDKFLDIPWKIINDSLSDLKKNATKYLFLDSNEERKRHIKAYFQQIHKINIDLDSFTLTQNSTSAIHLALRAIAFQKKRFLIITPFYFSVFKTLYNLGCNSLFFFHITLAPNFLPKFGEISRILEEQFIDVIVVTDPIFSSGVELGEKFLLEIIEAAKKFNCWIVYDFTLGGIEWDSEKKYLLDIKKFLLFKDIERLIYIDSPTKKLFLNGLKHAFVYSNPSVVAKMETFADDIMGGFSAEQIAIIPHLYSPGNQEYLSKILRNNISKFRDNYILLKNIIYESEFFFPETTCSFHTLLLHKKKFLYNIDEREITKRLLSEYGVYAIPISHFGYYKRNHFGYRINLSKHPRRLATGLTTIVNKQFDLFE